MGRRRTKAIAFALASAVFVAVLALGASTGALATLLPEGFFDQVPAAGQGQVAIEADSLFLNSGTQILTATGDVAASYQGYRVTGDKLVFDRRTSALEIIGNAVAAGPRGIQYAADRIELTGGFKQAVLEVMKMRTPDGAMLTGARADYTHEGQSVVTDGSYAPCGTCIDEKGRTIGWRVRAARMIYDFDTKTVTLEDGTLELVGMPVLWLPGVSFPDPSDPRASGIKLPSVTYHDQYGVRVNIPYFMALGTDTDLLFTPSLMSRQGLLLAVDFEHRFETGSVALSASGIYQLDPGAYAGEPGDRRWRGALQVSGSFVPVEHWTAGWSYTVFSDTAYLTDYELAGSPALNEVYATHLDTDSHADIRVQEFRLLGDVTGAQQDAQGVSLPVARADRVIELGDGKGRMILSADLIGVTRMGDDTDSANGVPYVFGYEGEKVHGTAEAAWSTQWIGPGGLVATPYLGVRLDAASYDGASALMPVASTLFAATPIAAIDVRWPLIATGNRGDVHIVEPIAQLVYRGSGTTETGITNDNAQSFIFDDTNLFSFNRFSGSDRQETGLRANIGGHYVATLANGGWFDAILGQSFHLAGVNAFGVSDGTLTGTSSGLGNTASYIVAGAQGSLMNGIALGGKVQIDPATLSVARAVVALDASYEAFGLDIAYAYTAADASLGVLVDQHEVAAEAALPLADYWALTAGLGWDLAGDSWLSAGAGVNYDDGYLEAGLNVEVTGATHVTPDDTRFTLNFKLNGPGGTPFGE